jgi:hypothetical protein
MQLHALREQVGGGFVDAKASPRGPSTLIDLH